MDTNNIRCPDCFEPCFNRTCRCYFEGTHKMDDRNYEVLKEEGGKPIKAWVKGVEFEDEAKKQVTNIARMPFVFPHVAVMPDVHAGIGATVGSVIPTLGAVIPAAVGVDIGCGMMALRLPLTASGLPESLAEIRSKIERVVPHGRTNNGGPGDRGAWGKPPERHQRGRDPQTDTPLGLMIALDWSSDRPRYWRKDV